jgi:hypothetical protein
MIKLYSYMSAVNFKPVQQENNNTDVLYTLAIVMSTVLGQGWRTFLRARAQIVDNFRRNPFAFPWEFWAAKLGLGVFHHHYYL